MIFNFGVATWTRNCCFTLNPKSSGSLLANLAGDLGRPLLATLANFACGRAGGPVLSGFEMFCFKVVSEIFEYCLWEASKYKSNHKTILQYESWMIIGYGT